MSADLFEMVDGGVLLLVMRPDGQGEAEILLLRPDDLPAFSRETAAALVLADLQALDRKLRDLGFRRDGTFTMRALVGVTGRSYGVVFRWLTHGMICCGGRRPGQGRLLSFDYKAVFSAALNSVLRKAGQAPDAVLRMVAAFVADPKRWEPAAGKARAQAGQTCPQAGNSR